MECYYRKDWYIEMDTQPYGFCPILTMDYGLWTMDCPEPLVPSWAVHSFPSLQQCTSLCSCVPMEVCSADWWPVTSACTFPVPLPEITKMATIQVYDTYRFWPFQTQAICWNSLNYLVEITSRCWVLLWCVLVKIVFSFTTNFRLRL